MNNKKIPATFAQQAMWLEHKLQPDSTAYNLPNVFKLTAPLNLPVLQQALMLLINRHETLRSYFEEMAGKIYQVIVPQCELNLEVIELRSNQPELDDSSAISQLIQEKSNIIFDLSILPYKFSLISINSSLYYLILNFHHIIVDGYSVSILLTDLSEFYNQLLMDGQFFPSKIESSMDHFLHEQEEYVQSKKCEEDLEVWRNILKDATFYTKLPQATSVNVSATTVLDYIVDKKTEKSLRLLASEYKTTLFIMLLSCFQILIYRYTGQEDITINYPVNSRSQRNLYDLGYKVNIFYSRFNYNRNLTFFDLIQNNIHQRELTKQTRNLPILKLSQALNKEGTNNHSIICNLLFGANYQEKLSFQNINSEFISIDLNHVLTELSLRYTIYDNKLLVKFRYSKESFSREFIENMAKNFQAILEDVTKNPCRQISEIPLLSQIQSSALKNQITLPIDTTLGIPGLFDKQVKIYGEKVAIHSKNYLWTYTDLNAEANKIRDALYSCLLPNLSVTTRVALLLDHDAPMIAGLMGILKAGQIYVPLDVNYPIERLTMMIADAEVGIIITEKKHEAVARKLVKDNIRLIFLEQLPTVDIYNPPAITPKNLAYIIYTSGSTGKIKGVLQNQYGLIHFKEAFASALNITSNDKLGLTANFCFDGHLNDIFVALLSGASLYRFDVKTHQPFEWFEWVNHHQITIYHSTPTLFRHLFGALNNTQLVNSLRWIVLGGETVHQEDIDLYYQRSSDSCKLMNIYGQTESSLSTLKVHDKNLKNSSISSSIGLPYPATSLQLLDKNGVAGQLIGEITVESSGVALGYWQNMDKTQQAFSETEQGRIYRTGDIGYLLPNGEIAYLGRLDHQVKIRGFRVELGEIEENLTSHPNVKHCVVLLKSKGGHDYLVAYIVEKERQATFHDILRQFLRERLPDYMCPHVYITLDQFPKTANGKIDRQQLISRDVNFHAEKQVVLAKTALEKVLTEIWSEILNLKQVGVTDNFFELGGHSLLALRLVWQIETRLQKKLPLKAIFKFSTIAEMAYFIEADKHQEDRFSKMLGKNLISLEQYRILLTVMSGAGVPAVREGSLMAGFNRSGNKIPIFWCGNDYHEQKRFSKYLGEEQPLYAMFSGFNVVKKEDSFTKALAKYYVEEIRAIQSKGPYSIAGNCTGAGVALEIALLLRSQGEKIAGLCLMEFFDPKLYDYGDTLLLLYGKQSHLKAFEAFHWRKWGWKRAFRLTPKVKWIPGIHGCYFIEPNIQILAKRVLEFFNSNVCLGLSN